MTTNAKICWMIRWDEGRLHYEIGAVTERLSVRIIEKHDGTPAEKEALVSDVTAMCRAFRAAVAAGGRTAYDAELARWKAHEFYENFQRAMDGAMTRMPYPRERLANHR